MVRAVSRNGNKGEGAIGLFEGASTLFVKALLKGFPSFV